MTESTEGRAPRITFQSGLTADQYDTLMKPIRASRVATRKQGGKDLSYVEAWEIKAHLTRIFGFCNWDSHLVEYRHVVDRPYSKDGKDMVEVVYSAHVALAIRDHQGLDLCHHSEAAVGSASGPASTLGDLHDNALKTAESDALKRCAINLGTQFGLSLYNNGSYNDVIKMTLIKPEGVSTVETPTDPEATARVEASLGATPVDA